VTPLALEVALNVKARLEARLEEANALRKKQVERAQYEADLARQRYMQVDPKNRLVADTLEADWNGKLRAVIEAQEDYEQQRKSDEQMLSEAQKEQILSLATDFSKLWKDPGTSDREKKRMVRLMLEDVTLIRAEQISVNVRFKGGALKMLTLPLPLSAFMERKTPPEIVEEINRLLDNYHDTEIANILNARGIQTGNRLPFTPQAVKRIRGAYQLKDRYTRLREKGMLHRSEMLKRFNTYDMILKNWRNKGWIKTHAYGNAAQNILYELPGEDVYAKIREMESNRRRNASKSQQPVAGGAV
jgi:hypothetical protein